MIERETVDGLMEAREKLDAAMDMISGLRTLLASDTEPALKNDIMAIRGALVVIHEGVQHANALIHSILDKGR